MGINVGVVGGTGYAGAELLRLLGQHAGFSVRAVAGAGSAGQSLAEAFPSLGMDVPIVPATAEALDGCDIVFLATPHAVSADLAPPLLEAGAAVVDLSGAFRLDAAAFARWYGMDHPAADLAPAPYGLPELFREDVPGARLIANPGCYPTAALLGLAPLRGLVDPASVIVTGMSGTSGAGKGLRNELHFSHAANNVAAYGAPTHRHTPEIAAGWGRLAHTAAPVTFTPHLVPMARGLLCTAVAQLTDDARPDDVAPAFAARFANEPFVRVLHHAWPHTAHVSGSNIAAVGFAVDPATRRVTVSCAIDNLIKGAAGQALQNANLLAGLDESEGLPTAGMYP